jgi:UDP-GlcNAc3NAcA epimerase
MEKLLTIIGTRPQFIKAAAVSRELRQSFHEVLVDTGQHYDYNMSGVFIDELELPKPDYNLEVGSGTHAMQTAAMMTQLEIIMEKERPDAVVVYGDTNSTLAGAIVASKLNVPLVHIEAGLRSFNPMMPEEINRKLTDHVSTLLFAPTDSAVANLKEEGINRNVYQVGDVMLDAVSYYWRASETDDCLAGYGVERRGYYLATIHRAENTDEPKRLRAIVEALCRLTEPVLLPMHPRTTKHLKQLGLDERMQKFPNIHLLEPASYLAMLQLERYAKAIITDSGGVQKEAFFAGVPCYTLRSETEWMETVYSGWNRLVDPEKEDLLQVINNGAGSADRPDFYGDGRAAAHIVRHLREWFATQSTELVS